LSEIKKVRSAKSGKVNTTTTNRRRGGEILRCLMEFEKGKKKKKS